MTHSTISLGLGLGGGRSATSSGKPGGGGALSNLLSASLDGTNDSIKTTYEPSATTTISFSMWVKSSNTSDPMGIFSNQTVGGEHNVAFLTHATHKGFFAIIKNSSGTQCLNLNLGGTNSTLEFRDGAWHHLAFTLNGSSVKIYKDGASWISSTMQTSDGWNTSGSYSGRSQPFYIGTNGALVSGNVYYFDGQIDEFGIFQSELSGSEISAIYNSGVPDTLSAAAWYRMGDGTGDTVSGGGSPTNGGEIGTIADQAGSANATGQNGPTYSNSVPG